MCFTDLLLFLISFTDVVFVLPMCSEPFEDGNGRIGRALTEFTLSQMMKCPVLLSLSKTIEKGKKQYYEQLKRGQRDLDITEWITILVKLF